jgi:hypothetical protein
VADATREFIRKFEMTAISTLEPVQDRHFKNETVELDGKRFMSCSFDGCTLNYSGGDVEFGPGCSAEHCRPIFSGPARRTVLLLRTLGLLAFDPDHEAKKWPK